MTGLGALVRRNTKLYFKDKGMFFASLITPIILLVLYASYADVKRIFFKPKPAVVAATQTAAPQTDDKPQEAN